MKKSVCVILSIVMLLVCVSCGNNEDELITDCQYNLISTYPNYFAESSEGLYLMRDSFLYYVDDELKLHVMCNKANCTHDDLDYCNGYFFAADNIFCYNKSLYILHLENNANHDLCVSEYTLQGEFVKKVAVIPKSFQSIILHRGVFYYTYYIEDEESEAFGLPTFASLPIDGESETVICQLESENNIFSKLFAYKDKVYVREMINNDDVTTTNTMVYDIGTGTTGKIENAANVCVSGDKLLFNIKGEDRKTVYMSDLDGGNVTETSLTMEDDNGLLCAYDNVVIGTNLIDYSVQAAKDGTFKQVFRVYKDNELKAEFSIDNVNGIDYSKNVISTILVTEKYVMVVLPDGAVAIMNKSDFEQGKIEPVIINI